MSIPALVEQCTAAFKNALVLSQSDLQCHGRLDDEFGRFRTWIANVSAHTYGRRSLQYRLRDASTLSSAVMRYLNELMSVLQLMQNMLQGTTSDVALSESESDEEDEDSNMFSSMTSRDLQSRLILTLDDIDEVVRCLLRISTTLRNPARHDQIRSTTAMHVKFFEANDIEHTKMKFPEAASFLTERVGRGISRNRQYCRYREEHHQRLAQGVYADVDESDDIQSTVATSLPGQEIPLQQTRHFESDAESVYTDTSFAPTLSGDSNLRLPPRPAAGTDGQPFECPICYVMISAEDELSWYRHVFEDVPPYMCTDPSCKTGSRQYARRRDWQHHMKLHQLVWICPYGCSPAFQSEHNLGEHLSRQHAQKLDRSSLHSIAKSCSKAEVNEVAPFTCPLCRQSCPTTKLWYKHVGHHMEQLALFALPQHTLDNSKDDADQTVESSESGNEEASSAMEEFLKRFPEARTLDRYAFSDTEPSTSTSELPPRVPIDAEHSEEDRVRIVDPPTEEEERRPRGILKKPKERFPDYPDPIREGVAPLKEASKDSGIPPGARWTKIDRQLVNPEALEEARERFEERLDCVIVLRPLAKEEIQKLADRTREIRAERYEESERTPARRRSRINNPSGEETPLKGILKEPTQEFDLSGKRPDTPPSKGVRFPSRSTKATPRLETRTEYEYTDARGMFNDTSPSWRYRDEPRPRRNNADRGTPEEPVTIHDPLAGVGSSRSRREDRDIGPPYGTRGWDEIDETARAGRSKNSPRSPTR